MKTGYYTADSVNGVHYYGVVLDIDADVLEPKEFYKHLKDGNTIYTFFAASDEEIFNKIDSEYGIDQG